MKLQFAFQGGGARLVPLVAAAHAVQDLSKEKGFEITCVAGTSAGSIPATMLAIGCPATTFKQLLIRHAEEYFEKIVREITIYSIATRSVFGRPLYNSDAYFEFLNKLFDEGSEFIGSGRYPELNVYSADIRSGSLRTVTYPANSLSSRPSQGATADFVQAVYDSSAIPFIFRTHKDKSELVDGGLLRNFPTNDLVKRTDENGQVLGFTFKPQKYSANGKFLNYIGSLIGTSIDYGVKVSSELLEEENVHQLATDLGMLDFSGALSEVKGTAYEGYYRSAEGFIKEYLDRCSSSGGGGALIDNLEIVSPDVTSAKFIRGVVGLHTDLRASSKFRVRKRIFRYTCRTLAKGIYDVPTHDDELKIVDEVFPTTPLAAYGCRLISEGDPYDPREVSVAAYKTKDRGKRAKTSALTLPPTHISGIDAECSNVMVFFPAPLTSDQSDPDDSWTISYSCGAEEPMSYIIQNKYDCVGHFNAGDSPVEELIIICDVPTKYAGVHLSDLRPDKRPEGHKEWVNGRIMTDEELGGYDLSPAGFVAVGWVAYNVKPGAAAGFEGSMD